MKQMMRRKYLFPQMDRLIDTVMSQCFECQTVTKTTRMEPVKPTEIPEEPWDVVATEFGGLFPDGHYNLVMIDKRSRYPVVKELPSTDFKKVRSAFKEMFATYGTPRRVESDGGPPFNGKDFAEFAKIEGFQHHIVTPEHARANGEAERFMKTLNKAEKIIQTKTKDKYDRQSMVQDMLTAYRDTPHPATGITPYEAMNSRKIRTKLGTTMTGIPSKEEINSTEMQSTRGKWQNTTTSTGTHRNTLS